MWEFVTFESPDALAEDAAATLGLTLRMDPRATSFLHQTTHRTITFRVQRATAIGGRLKPGAAEWITLRAAEALPLAKPQTRVLGWLNA
jgi:adenine-specific DNA glycosylase